MAEPPCLESDSFVRREKETSENTHTHLHVMPCTTQESTSKKAISRWSPLTRMGSPNKLLFTKEGLATSFTKFYPLTTHHIHKYVLYNRTCIYGTDLNPILMTSTTVFLLEDKLFLDYCFRKECPRIRWRSLRCLTALLDMAVRHQISQDLTLNLPLTLSSQDGKDFFQWNKAAMLGELQEESI